MPISKIKSHRIGDKQIKLNHLDTLINIPESMLKLNYPTHSNAGDLTVEQRNILTQMGNADSLHYHTGGGGGPNGIYTNEERDVQLLKLSMLINSTLYGLDKSVKDILKDDSSIDYGLQPAKPPTLQNLTDDSIYGGTLEANKTYTYGLAFKNLYGRTNIINFETITTGNGANNAVKIIPGDIPADNQGIEIYRTEGLSEKLLTDAEDINEFKNPFNLDIDLAKGDKTSGLNSLMIYTYGYSDGSGNPTYNIQDITQGIGKRILSYSEQLGSVVTKNVPFSYYIQVMNKGLVNRLDILWDTNPNYIPLEYEIYYTTDFISDTVYDVKWNKFERLSKVQNIYDVPLQLSTNGEIIDNYFIRNNTKAINIFTFKPVPNISAIRIVIKKYLNGVVLNNIRMFTINNSTYSIITKDFGSPRNFSEYSTVRFDLKSDSSHNRLKLGFLKNSETISTITNEWNLTVTKDFGSPRNFSEYSTLRFDLKSDSSHNRLKLGFLKNSETISTITNEWNLTCNTTTVDLTGKTVRNVVRDSSSAINRYGQGFDRIRITLRPEPGQYIRIENVYLTICAKASDHNINYLMDPDYINEVIVPITWNNGLSYYEGTPSSTITSDWAYISFPNKSFIRYVVTFTVVTGKLRNVSDGGTQYGIIDSKFGAEAIKWSDSVTSANVNINYNYNFIEKIEIGKSNSQYLDTNYLNDTVIEKWNRHYIELPSGTAMQDVRRMMLYFDKLITNQTFMIDNIRLSHNKNVLTQITGTNFVATNGCQGASNVKLNDSSIFYSDLQPTQIAPKSIMFTNNTPFTVNKLIIYFGYKNNAGKTYAIQYSNNPSADVHDPYNSINWSNVEELSIDNDGIKSYFTGNIVGNVIYNNNVYDINLTHKFKPITATKFRIVFFETINNDILKITNIKLFTAEDNDNFKLIYSKNTPVAVGEIFIDDGKPGTINAIPLTYNLSGTFNVYFDKYLKLLKLIDPSREGIVYFDKLNIGLYKHIIFTAQTIGNVEFYASNNDGYSFNKIDLDKLYTFDNQGESIIIKARLLSEDAAINAIAFLYSL